MSDAPDEPNDERLLFLQQLLEDRATIAADVFEVDPRTWAIHGIIPVGGDVIMAEFESEDQAKEVLAQLAAQDPDPPVL